MIELPNAWFSEDTSPYDLQNMKVYNLVNLTPVLVCIFLILCVEVKIYKLF